MRSLIQGIETKKLAILLGFFFTILAPIALSLFGNLHSFIPSADSVFHKLVIVGVRTVPSGFGISHLARRWSPFRGIWQRSNRTGQFPEPEVVNSGA